ncbi:DUF4376 domain-containing protein [Oxalobacter aliiformigenes]|uniref:DUF4376 domain-containing protein n=1 Tax=Oxalobacter aliiformigenes TaxID=2946593 RepID=UPI0022AED0B9|nr:DUF4376 domain-containing protein [Oxalobacter aliiformigenes]MCZ4064119.1 DUF4376 domain-containing protein [Oxalobacter aliiformigenes]WAV99495.1 DUF4376 domain-containing protein [Oxalobacter aliiformigenes]
MKYGIVENHKFILIDEDRQRLENTIPFMPGLKETDIVSYEDSEIEQGHDGVWYEKGHAPQRPLEEVKTEKLAELETAFARASQEAHCTSSVGFEIDADEIANRNIEGLVLVMQPEQTTLFRAYDNSFHEVTREQLEVMRKEIVINSQYLYQAKWTTEAKIKAAETAEALDTIVITAEALAELADNLKVSAGETEETTEDTVGEKEHVQTA